MRLRLFALLLCACFLGTGPSIATASTAHAASHQPAPGLSLLAQRWKAKALNFLAEVESRAVRYLPAPPAAAALPDGGGTDAFSIVSLCCGVAILFTVGLTGPAALVFGIISLNRIKRTGDRGRGMAIAGIVLGAIGTLFLGLYIALVLASL